MKKKLQKHSSKRSLKRSLKHKSHDGSNNFNLGSDSFPASPPRLTSNMRIYNRQTPPYVSPQNSPISRRYISPRFLQGQEQDYRWSNEVNQERYMRRLDQAPTSFLPQNHSIQQFTLPILNSPPSLSQNNQTPMINSPPSLIPQRIRSRRSGIRNRLSRPRPRQSRRSRR